MTYQDLVSQLPYALAPILICSALLKSVMESFTNIRTERIHQPQMKFSIKHSFEPIIKSFEESSWLWRIELIIAFCVILFCAYGGPLRGVTQLTMVGLFAGFAVVCFIDLTRKSQQPCRCFGNLSNKPARSFSCVRNAVLCLLAVLGLFAEPASLSALGLILVVIVLGAILFEEIR